MNDSIIYLSGILITVFICLIFVFLLKPKFKIILIDYCGGEDRANFWLIISNILLILVPLIFAMTIFPNQAEDMNIFFVLSKQVKWGLIGFISSLVALCIILVAFIPKNK